MPKFNLDKLKVRIFEKNLTKDSFGKLMGWSNGTGYYKLKGERVFTQEEIYKATEILEIDPEEIGDYFFIRNK